MKRYLRDTSFLKAIDNLKVKEQIVKITILDFTEHPIEEIQAKVESGSLNLNGDSRIRRTGNLTILGDTIKNDITNADSLFSLNKKIKIELGIKNTTFKYQDEPYIWFPLGIFVITDCSISHNEQSIEISISFQDKMCLLSGESGCGGLFSQAVTFDTDAENKKVPVFQIIQELVHHFGGESLGKILISDVPKKISAIVRWNSSNEDLFLIKTLKKANNSGETAYQYEAQVGVELAQSIHIGYGQSLETYTYGDIIGYTYEDFVYSRDLVGDIGSAVTDVLDNIVNYLGGNFEYFYDVHGNFIFQEIKNYLNTSYATVLESNLSNVEYINNKGFTKAVYNFEGSELISTYSNNPQYSKIKNDYVVWGNYSSDEDAASAFRYHLAIDTKPAIGNTYNVYIVQDEYGDKRAYMPIIYNKMTDFPRIGEEGKYYGLKRRQSIGATTTIVYELYQWVYSPASKKFGYSKVNNANYTSITTKDWRTELYLSGMQASNGNNLGLEVNYYYPELYYEWPRIYDIEQGCFKQEALSDRSTIKYFLDFIEPDTNLLNNICVKNIGRRSVVSDFSNEEVNCMFEPVIPSIVYIRNGVDNTDELIERCKANNNSYILVNSDIYNKIQMQSAYQSAYSVIRNYLYEHTSFQNAINLTTVPIYYLDVNQLVSVEDPISNIFGDYIINSIALPLDGSQMTIGASRALERI